MLLATPFAEDEVVDRLRKLPNLAKVPMILDTVEEVDPVEEEAVQFAFVFLPIFSVCIKQPK